MSINWPKSLIQAIARRRAVILIGSGVSANAKNAAGQSPPTWKKFLSDSHSALGPGKSYIKNAIKQNRYLEACDYLKSEYSTNWNNHLRSAFVDPLFKPADIHRAIFELDCRIVCSLNFDKIYETYASQSSENTVILKNYYDGDIRQCVADEGRYIIKPHGTIDSPTKLIFTLDEYAKSRIEYASFYEIITALLHTHTFLCIGCGISDPDMQLIFEDYKYKHKESPHYITFPETISTQEIQLLQKTRGLNVLKYSSRDQHKELTQSIFDLGKSITKAREAIASDQNW